MSELDYLPDSVTAEEDIDINDENLGCIAICVWHAHVCECAKPVEAEVNSGWLLQLELWTAVTCLILGWELTWVLCKSSTPSQLLNHFLSTGYSYEAT